MKKHLYYASAVQECRYDFDLCIRPMFDDFSDDAVSHIANVFTERSVYLCDGSWVYDQDACDINSLLDLAVDFCWRA